MSINDADNRKRTGPEKDDDALELAYELLGDVEQDHPLIHRCRCVITSIRNGTNQGTLPQVCAFLRSVATVDDDRDQRRIEEAEFIVAEVAEL